MTLSEIIAKLEAANEGSRELDIEIWRQCAPQQYKITEIHSRAFSGREWTDEEKALQVRSQAIKYAPRYTTSLDPALTLVPEGWRTKLRMFRAKNRAELELAPDQRQQTFGLGKTAALALCIAALKARAK